MDDSESFPDLEAAFNAANVAISRSQLERWRGKGLLPRVHTIGKGRPTGGSVVRYPAGTAAQAIEIKRRLDANETFALVGWNLWMQGFSVKEAFWREPLAAAQAALPTFFAKLSALESDADLDQTGADTIFDNIDISIARAAPNYAPLARIPKDRRASLFGISADIFLGQFSGFRKIDDDDDRKELRDVKAVMGFPNRSPHKISGQGINYDDVESVLKTISSKLDFSVTLPDAEPPIEIRKEFSNAFGIAGSMHGALEPIYGRNALGLRIAAEIKQSKLVIDQALMLLIWSELRQHLTNIRSPAEISTMAKEAEIIAEQSQELMCGIIKLPEAEQVGRIKELRRDFSKSKRIK